jgi:hypothetical protein
MSRQIKIPRLITEDICLSKKIDEETLEEIAYNCIPKAHFENSGDFRARRVVVFDFVELTAQQDGENGEDDTKYKQKVFERNMGILKRRIDLMGVGDYELNALQEGDSYKAELIFTDDSFQKVYAFALLTSKGAVEIYTDDVNYEVPEESETEEESSPNYQEGKIASEFLSINDLKRAGVFFDSTIINGMGGYTIKLEFGENNKDKVMLTAQSFNTNVSRPGIQLFLDGFPIAEQVEYIAPLQAGYDGQSYIKFIPFGDPNNELQTRAIKSMVLSDIIDTQIQLSDISSISSKFDVNTIENVKLMLPFGIFMSCLLAILLYKKKGLLFSVLLASQIIFSFAFYKMFNVLLNMNIQLNMGLVLGYIGTYFFVGFVLLCLLQKKFGINDLENRQKDIRSLYYVLLIAIVCVDVLYISFDVSSSNVFGAVLFGFNVFWVSLLYMSDFIFPAFAPSKLFWNKETKS